VARPKKDPGEKRENRLTLYLTSREEEELNLLAESMGVNKTKIITRALQNYVKTLENSPPVLRKNKMHEVMRLEEERSGPGPAVSHLHLKSNNENARQPVSRISKVDRQ